MNGNWREGDVEETTNVLETEHTSYCEETQQRMLKVEINGELSPVET
jgi:hypothetical protein